MPKYIIFILLSFIIFSISSNFVNIIKGGPAFFRAHSIKFCSVLSPVYFSGILFLKKYSVGIENILYLCEILSPSIDIFATIIFSLFNILETFSNTGRNLIQWIHLEE